MNKAVFLDRDGVINDNKNPVNKPEDLIIYPWTYEAIRLLNDAGYYVFIVTNQGGIEMGYFKEKDLQNIHDKLLNEIAKNEAKIDEIAFCPHFKTKCNCRKPSAGMITDLAEKYNIDLNISFMVGDREVDIEAGIAAGCKTIKIGKKYKNADYTVNNLLDAAKTILNKKS